MSQSTNPVSYNPVLYYVSKNGVVIGACWLHTNDTQKCYTISHVSKLLNGELPDGLEVIDYQNVDETTFSVALWQVIKQG